MPNFCVGFHNTYSAYCQSYKKAKMPKPTTKRSEITVYVSAYDASRYVLRNRGGLVNSVGCFAYSCDSC